MPKGILIDMGVKSDPQPESESWNTLFIILVLSPLLFSFGYEFYFWFVGISYEAVSPLFVSLGMLGFGLPLLAMGSFMVFSRFIKLGLLIVSEVWFVWFWVVTPFSWFAYLPLILAFIIIQTQKSKIQVTVK